MLIDFENLIDDALEHQRISDKKLEIKRLMRDHKLDEFEAVELYELLKYFQPLKFTSSKQISQYIMKHKLGRKYPNISGIVEMENQGNRWDFNGGLSPRIYGVVCRELGLRNQESDARVIKYTSFGSKDSF